MRASLLALLATAFVIPVHAVGPPPRKYDSVTIELRGKLCVEVKTSSDGVKTKEYWLDIRQQGGGYRNGFRVGRVWPLDLRGNSDLRAAAEKLVGKSVRVTGQVYVTYVRELVPGQCPPVWVLTVRSDGL